MVFKFWLKPGKITTIPLTKVGAYWCNTWRTNSI